MTKNKIFAVATAHLDTVWRWELAKTIEEFIPDTIEKNIALIEKYPHYRFNFEGAFRYELIEEYYPEAFEKIKQLVADGKWCVSGSAYENGDVNIPSPEALFRNFLYGNGYFKKKFGKTSKDVFLPDCFGFGYALPSVAKHSGLLGVSTQKLGWGGAYERPFDIGVWRGVDGSSIYASLDPLSYRYKFNGDVRGDLQIINKIADNGINCALPWTMNYYGTGDWGGAPTEESVLSVNYSVEKNEGNETQVISASSDEIFIELDKLPENEKAGLPVWDNELVMRSHGAGGYTSRCMSKRLNAQNEALADYCEKSAVSASLLTSFKYPREIIDSAWKKVIAHQFHDDIPGTSTMLVYNESWNDYFASLKQFQGEYQASVGALANELDTSWCEDCAVIVNNPVAVERTCAVEAHIKLTRNAKYVKVLDEKGNEVPSQVVSKNGKEFDIIFLASVASVGYRVYDVQGADEKCTLKTDLAVTAHTLENANYKVIFNKNGDLASLFDKKLNKQLLSAPVKFALHHNLGELNYPSWEMRKEDLDSEPYCYANTPTFEVVDDGPARVSIKITRTANSSTVVQLVSLEAGGDTVRVDNFIDWLERRTLLKAQFPLSCSNPVASYDLGLGYIKRGNNTENLYEVPAQKWADLTDENDEYGVSIFSDCKYGWDKPSDNMLRLTCIHTPAGAFTKDARQDLQDLGRNYFSFGICSHKGALGSQTQIGAQCFNQKPVAFVTSSKKSGSLTHSFSLASLSTNDVVLRAVKLAQDSDSIVVRVNEGVGQAHKKVELRFFADVVKAEEATACEEVVAPAKYKKNKIIFDINPFETKTFVLTLDSKKNTASENYKKLTLDYNASGITADDYKVNCILQGSGCSLPDELINESYTVSGVTFRMPKAAMQKNVLIPRGQTIELPKGMTKLYIIAASVLSDKEITLLADNKERKITVHSMTDFVGKWDMFGLEQTASVKSSPLALEFSHTHHPEGNLPNRKAYFYLYEVDVRNCRTLTLPEENKVVILAMTAVKRFSNTRLATKLIDSPDEGYTFAETPVVDKILDKADFVTIRAGKIQDQIKGGKGKGFKRDNIITNIIRSYTKSEW